MLELPHGYLKVNVFENENKGTMSSRKQETGHGGATKDGAPKTFATRAGPFIMYGGRNQSVCIIRTMGSPCV